MFIPHSFVIYSHLFVSLFICSFLPSLVLPNHPSVLTQIVAQARVCDAVDSSPASDHSETIMSRRRRVTNRSPHTNSSSESQLTPIKCSPSTRAHAHTRLHTRSAHFGRLFFIVDAKCCFGHISEADRWTVRRADLAS